jgi:ABC-type Mn2+/Zn2+ transport system permease subunit
MRLIELLTGPAAPLFHNAILAAIPIALACSLLSVFVVLRRLAFIGQGISHAAFGGVGLATLLGLSGTMYFGVVGLFCIGAALLIAWTRDRQATRDDTTIGIVLVASMALGILLMQLWVEVRNDAWYIEWLGEPRAAVGWEAILFGSILAVGREGLVLAYVFGGVVLACLVIWRHPLVFYAFDEAGAEAFGVNTRLFRYLLIVLLAITVVISIRLAGLILATALLILPGATALRLSVRMRRVIGLSVLTGLVGVVGGLLLSLQLNLPPGACMVALLVLLYAATWPIGLVRRGRMEAAPTGAPAVGETHES